MLAYPKSTLSKFYGLHSVIVPNGQNDGANHADVKGGRRRAHAKRVYFSVIGNVFDPEKSIHQRFDCKGSTAGRKAKPRDRAQGDSFCVYKDLDWKEMGRRIRMSKPQKRQFSAQVSADVDFLRRQVTCATRKAVPRTPSNPMPARYLFVAFLRCRMC
jgi:1-phosphatidylinositol-4-phosphate 5-kinase